MKRADAEAALLEGCKQHLTKIVGNLVGDILDGSKTMTVEIAAEHFDKGLAHAMLFFDEALVRIEKRLKD